MPVLKEGKQSMPTRKWTIAVVIAGLIGASLTGTSAAGARAPTTPHDAAAERVVAPSGTTTASTPVERGPSAPTAAAPSPRRGDDLVNLPAEPLDTYKAMKAAASGNKASQAPAKPEGRQGVVPAGEPSTVTKNFKGVDFAGAGSAFPPDTHGAVGIVDYLQIVNTRLRAYRTSDNALVRDQNLAAFFGDTDFVFDPRALYDNTWNRYVVLASRKADSPTDRQRHYWLGISTSSLATGSFRIYKVNFGFNPGDWCDFPQLGMDQDAVIITCNMFHVNDAAGTSSFINTYVTSIAKARVYNGYEFSVPSFLPPDSSSIAPPLVAGVPLQQPNRSFLIAANAVSDVVSLFRMENTAHPTQTSLVLQANVPVTPWDIPPLASNGGGPLLDTLDGRFQNNSVQNGTSLWNVHTERVVRNGIPYSRPRFYEINTTTSEVARQGTFSLDFTSDDWNASIGVSESQEAFFTFSSARNNLFPQIRTGGCQVAVDGCSGDIGPGTLIVSSTSYSLHVDGSGRNRYGDYTAVSLDPTGVSGCASQRRAWITNQYTDSTDHRWGSRIARIGFC
jgi:hypothetical protein